MSKTLDTTAIIKGILEPRRTKNDGIRQEQIRIYKIASSILDDIRDGREKLFIPAISIIETAAVASRLTGSESIGRKAAETVSKLAFRTIGEGEFLEEAIAIAAKTKISGFDSIFIACAKLTGSILITDDKKMHEAALNAGVQAKLLREMRS